MEISVVIPVYGCPQAIEPLCKRLNSTLKKLTEEYEIILVNDHCPRNSWTEIEKVCKDNQRIKGLDLSRNFGQQRAIIAGLDHSSGNYVVVMDCDLQDKPEDIENLYNVIKNSDYDLIFAKDKRDAKKKLTSKLFYKLYSKIMNVDYDQNLSNFGIYKRTVIDALIAMRESYRGFTSYIKWMGFRQGVLEIERGNRYEGKTGYSFKKRMQSALDILYSQTDFPIKQIFNLGIIVFLFSILGLITTLITCLCFKLYYVLTILMIVMMSLFVLGITLIALGILGNYVVRTYMESKNRPLYFVREIINGNK